MTKTGETRYRDVEDFQAGLRAHGGYQTAPAARASRPWRGSVWYHWQQLRVVWAASRVARRGAYDSREWSVSSLRTLRLVERCGGRVTIAGLEPVTPSDWPVVFIANHMSTLETFLLPCILLTFGRIAFVIKQSLLTYPLFWTVMRAVPSIAVTRLNPREDLKQVLTQGTDLLKRGISVIIFPQATRLVEFDLEAFNTLGIKLAARAGVPAIPLALKTDFLGNGRWLKEFGTIAPRKDVEFKFGPRLKVAGNGKAEQALVVAFIRAQFMAWGGTVRMGTGARDAAQG